jgi:hypothetical protein
MMLQSWLKTTVGVALSASVLLSTTAAHATDETPPAEPNAMTAEPTHAAHPPAHLPVVTRIPHGRRIPHTSEAILTERVRLLTAELELTDQQQTEVRAILVRQSDAIRKVWTDRSLTDGERGPITGAIGEKTADAIRDLLSPRQREKYNPPRPNTDRLKPEQAKDLTKWLDAFQQK